MCIECGGKSICGHKKVKFRCKECKGNGICKHNISKYICKECDGRSLCIHNRQKYQCRKCYTKIIFSIKMRVRNPQNIEVDINDYQEHFWRVRRLLRERQNVAILFDNSIITLCDNKEYDDNNPKPKLYIDKTFKKFLPEIYTEYLEIAEDLNIFIELL